MMRGRLHSTLFSSRLWFLLAAAFALVVCRLVLGALFASTRDQFGYVVLWMFTERGINPYEHGQIVAWPPFWWIAVAVWAKAYQVLSLFLPGFEAVVSKCAFLKWLYYLFECALAILLGAFIAAGGGEGNGLRLSAEQRGRAARLALGFC